MCVGWKVERVGVKFDSPLGEYISVCSVLRAAVFNRWMSCCGWSIGLQEFVRLIGG